MPRPPVFIPYKLTSSNIIVMEHLEHEFHGLKIPGGLGVVLVFAFVGLGIWQFIAQEPINIFWGVMCIIGIIITLMGFVLLEPNESFVLLFFGRYRGTLRRTGLTWINPLLTKRKMSLRINNLDIAPIKVNDRTGNPVMIGMVLVWKVSDTYRASFDVDAQDTDRARALRNFVAIQGDAALREVAGHFAYDEEDGGHEVTLRGGGEVITKQLEEKINERLEIAGITVVEARINYLAYAPEIAAVMLKRQQASAIIAAREKIVEGAVSMVKMALDSIDQQMTVKMDNDRRATIIGNLLMVLCSDDSAQPVIPTN